MTRSVQPSAEKALAEAKPAVFWTDRPDGPDPSPSLTGTVTTDLAIVGGGFSGLWAAIQALEERPGMRVTVLESEVCGFGASSRNGGFCDASLTHGLHNGLAHWPQEMETLVRLGNENLACIEATITRHGIDADFRLVGEISVATQQWQLDELTTAVADYQRFGNQVELLDMAAMQDCVHSPTYLGGLRRRTGTALVDPGRLCWGLKALAEKLGATIHDHSPALGIEAHRSGLAVTTPGGMLQSDRVVVATNAYQSPIRRPRRYVIPVYDHVLMTAPLSTDQLDSIGWNGREGIGDCANQFHYYRLTEDDRILWGGYDATYHFNNGIQPSFDQREETHLTIAAHFFDTFPQLEGLGFTHRWGGPIGTTTKFTATWGTAHDGRLAWVAGYTGLGVGASRFGARVALDLVFGKATERTELEMVRRKPFPFPPEPLRWAAVQITRRAIQRADRHGGKRGLWLGLLDRFGVGFDS
jgi:glycine/D-amino acid oxidase-like deaminating enzyme